jgi:hypothetical protein
VWVAVQRNWLYLQPIFESADINRQLPTEGKKFAIILSKSLTLVILMQKQYNKWTG